MNIIHINQGQKVNFQVIENTIIFNNQYSVNCQERQSDIQQKIDIFLNQGNISELPSGQYIANIIIPPKRYLLDDQNYQNFDINSVILQLWSI